MYVYTRYIVLHSLFLFDVLLSILIRTCVPIIIIHTYVCMQHSQILLTVHICGQNRITTDHYNTPSHLPQRLHRHHKTNFKKTPFTPYHSGKINRPIIHIYNK